MAFSNRLSERMEELRLPNPRSPPEESLYSAFNGTSRNQNSFFSTFQQPSSDARGSLTRRFTTDSSKTSSFGQQYPPMTAAQLRNQREIEAVREQKRKTDAHLELLIRQEQNLNQGSPVPDIDRISNTMNRISLNGPVSEPTTPPEYADSGMSRRYSRSSRFSASNVTSPPPGLTNRFSQSGSRITSPPSGQFNGSGMYNQSQKPPAQSMPGSRRGSDDEEYFPEQLPMPRSTAGLNRFSMPANGTRNAQRFSMPLGTKSSTSVLGPLNTTSFLFDDHDDKHLSLTGALDPTSPVAKALAQLDGDDAFPKLTGDIISGKLSANSAALDLANSITPGPEAFRYRPNHQSMPHTDSSMYRPALGNLNSPPSEPPIELSGAKVQRHTIGVGYNNPSSYVDGPVLPTSRPGSLQTSFSTNDVPTVKNSINLDSIVTPPKSHAEQQFHNHNVSLGRIPPNGVNNRQSRDMGNGFGSVDGKRDDMQHMTSPTASGLQASAAPFGPQTSAPADMSLMNITSPSNTSYTSPQTYAYGMHNFNYNQMASQMAINGAVQSYQSPAQGQFGGVAAYAKAPDGSARGTGRRAHNGDDPRFNNVPLETYRGNLYELCKDQHGCRYLQRKLEDGNADHIQLIFFETCPHIVELMTDPFGNYLCQKLFEHCNDEQRTALINTASLALTSIALNQHGTRALQKMIDFVNTDEQVRTIVVSLSDRVVELVQDLNGNHVIQKCLNRLGAEKSQFIYEAVGMHCIVVGTHRHGCCVLQRCIDHAVGAQRATLIARITHNAFALVQDPFGNYVVQYILDLDEQQFTSPLCQAFAGKICALSKQKFSSNVIEKCLRTADSDTKRFMIDEMLMGNELEKMLRDSFANYVVQTAIDHADPETKMRIIDCVRPILPAIKQTPHGRRIASKIMGAESQGRLNGSPSGQLTPSDTFSSQAGFSSGGRTGSGRRQVQIVGGGFNGPRYNPMNSYTANDSMDNKSNNYGSGNNYSGMNGVGGDFGESPTSMYNNNHHNTSSVQNAYATFATGQMGNNYF